MEKLSQASRNKLQLRVFSSSIKSREYQKSERMLIATSVPELMPSNVLFSYLKGVK